MLINFCLALTFCLHFTSGPIYLHFYKAVPFGIAAQYFVILFVYKNVVQLH